MQISFFEKITQTKGGKEIDFADFIDKVREGEWQDAILEARKYYLDNPDRYKTLKRNLPYVTLSGVFEHRANTGLIKHSGLLAIDIDHVDVIEIEPKLRADKHTFALFRSASGHGLCLVVKIKPARHESAFIGAQEYYLRNFDLVIDQACKDVARPRFVSYDPDVYYNPESVKFEHYLHDAKTPKSLPGPYYTTRDFERIISEIEEKQVDITGDYPQWLALAFSICSEFGEAGLDTFLRVSRFSNKYDEDKARKQYKACVRDGSRKYTISTFFYFAKLAGITINSYETSEMVFFAQMSNRNNVKKQSAVEDAIEHFGFDPDEYEMIVDQVYSNGDSTNHNDLPLIKKVLMYVTSKHNIRHNQVTDIFEILRDGQWQELTERNRNEMLIELHWLLGDKVTRSMIDACIESESIQSVDPLQAWFNTRGPAKVGSISRLANTLVSKSEWSEEWESEFDGMTYVEYFLQKWLVGVVSTVFGDPSRLVLILTGSSQNKGKTHWITNLLPKELNSGTQKYFSVVFFDKGEKDELQLTRNMLILIDELRGGMQKNLPLLKQLTSMKEWSGRKAYSKNYSRYPRRAGLAGTTNEDDFILESEGQTRIIPINVQDVHQSDYNAINMEDVWTEAYWLWKDKEVSHRLSEREQQALATQATEHQAVIAEREMLLEFFEPCRWDNELEAKYAQRMTATQMLNYLNARTSHLNLKLPELTKALKELGYEKRNVRVDGRANRNTFLVRKLHPDTIQAVSIEDRQ